MKKTLKDNSQVIASAHYLIKTLLNTNPDKCDIKHLKELLSVLIWKITEVNGKYNLDYSSKAALNENKRNLIHEHVFERAKLVEELLLNSNDFENILKKAIACLVTKDEHLTLSKVDKNLHGWARYQAAGIEVIEVRSGNRFDAFEAKKAA